MTFVPYSLQPILNDVAVDPTSPPAEAVSPSTSSRNLFSRQRATSSSTEARSPPGSPQGVASRFRGLAAAGKQGIEAVEAWDNNLYVGTSDGHILHYVIEEQQSELNSDDAKYSSRLDAKINLELGKKVVEKIVVLPQVSKAMVLCDSTISFYTLPFFEPIPVSIIPQIKGVSCFTHDTAQDGQIGEDGTIKLCVIKRRMIQLYKIGELVQLKKEVPLPNGAITVARHRHNLCLADMHQYKLVNLQLSTATALIPTPQSISGSQGSTPQSPGTFIPKPLIAVVGDGEFLVVSGNVNNQTTIGIFVNSVGDAIRGTLQWASYPRSITVQFPYVIALLRNKTIEIHNIRDQQCVQTLELQPGIEPKGLCMAYGIKVWAEGLTTRLKQHQWSPPHVAPLNNIDCDLLNQQLSRSYLIPTRLLLYNKDSIMGLLATPLIVRADALLDTNQVEAGVALANQTQLNLPQGARGGRIRHELDYIYQKAGFLLLGETLFDDAFRLFSKGNVNPVVIIHLFKNLSIQQEENCIPDVVLYEGVKKIVDKLGRIEDIVGRNIERNYSPHIQPDVETATATVELRRVLLLNAHEAVQKYLIREQIGYNKEARGSVTSKCINTALLKIYVEKEDSGKLYELIQSSSNECASKDSEDALMKAKKYYALSLFYKYTSNVSEVLDIWTRIYTGELEDPDFTDGLNRIRDEMLDLDTSQQSINIINKYGWWLVKQNAVEGVRVFMQCKAADLLDQDDILKRLEPYGNAAAQTYLEYLVQGKGSGSPEHHTRLACSYAKDVQVAMEKKENVEYFDKIVQDYKSQVAASEKQRISQSLAKPHTTFMAYMANQVTDSSLIQVRLRLLKLLQASRKYDPNTVLDYFISNEHLHLERVIIYGRLQKHEEALQILTLTLNDFTAAELYCVTGGHSIGNAQSQPPKQPTRPKITSVTRKLAYLEDKELPRLPRMTVEDIKDRHDLCLLLLKMYLNISDKDMSQYRSLHLLNTQGLYLDLEEVLYLLPDDWPLHVLERFLTQAFRKATEKRLQGKIALGLSRGENLVVAHRLFKLQDDLGPTIIASDSICSKCENYLGDSIAVKNMDGGDVFHLQCAKEDGLV
ncbi:hypothetical protein VKS41_003834 [Umbelopsis sp. WA50703]